jgi:hypothetical protein
MSLKGTGTYRFVIERNQFAKLERALLVAVPAAQSLGTDAGIFWLRGSIFAATPHASIGVANLDIELRPERITREAPDRFAISQLVANRLLIELCSNRVLYLERIGLVVTRDEVLFKFDYDSESNLEGRGVVSRYVGSWFPRMTPREHYELLFENQFYFYHTQPIKDVWAKLRGNESDSEILDDRVVLGEFPGIIPPVTISRSLLQVLLDAARDEDMGFRFGYYGSQYPIVCQVDDVIAILPVVG